MAEIEKVNGYVGNFVTGTLFSGVNPPIGDGIVQIQGFKITVQDDSGNPVDLQSRDGDTQGEWNQLVELMVQEMQPLIYFAPSDASGEIHVILDGHANTVSSLESRLKPVVAGLVSNATEDNNQTSVEVATSMTLGVA